ncbi:MAG: hypothetical protein QOJ79_2529 [Actinomycetota bacterium]|nr:hypothetical protein [Actinomycetota bacterium]
MKDVKTLASWTGWCDPCETERPLILTETGERGLAAWLRGVGDEDRSLTLTCRVCGEWQLVPYDEPDVTDDEQPAAPLVALRPIGQRQIVLTKPKAFTPYPVVPLPAPRRRAQADADMSLDLLTQGLDLITLAG